MKKIFLPTLALVLAFMSVSCMEKADLPAQYELGYITVEMADSSAEMLYQFKAGVMFDVVAKQKVHEKLDLVKEEAMALVTDLVAAKTSSEINLDDTTALADEITAAVNAMSEEFDIDGVVLVETSLREVPAAGIGDEE